MKQYLMVFASDSFSDGLAPKHYATGDLLVP